jgi:hypothetical protein
MKVAGCFGSLVEPSDSTKARKLVNSLRTTCYSSRTLLHGETEIEE